MRKLLTILFCVITAFLKAQCIESILFSGYLDTEGSLYTWGSFNGQGNGAETSWLPGQVGNVGEWKTLGANFTKFFAIKNDDTLWEWGPAFNAFGNPIGIDHEVPTQVGTGSDWKSVSSSHLHAIGIKTDGTLWGWGFNFDGQVGNNSFSNVPNPVKIGNDNDWKVVCAGGNFSAALKNDGTLWAWGASYNYMTIDQQKTPMQIGTDDNWSMIAAGHRFFVGLKSDGTLWEWGFKGYSNAIGSSSNYLWPTQTDSGNDWKYIAANMYKFYAIKENGELYYWGNAVTDGSENLNNPNEPTRFGNDSDWAKVSAGFSQTVAVKNDGSLWRWGIVSQSGNQAIYSYEAQLVKECEATVPEEPSTCNCDCLFIANPVHEYASIIYDNTVSIYDGISIFDVTGKRIVKKLENENSIYVGELQQGIYFAEITCNGKRYFKKFFKL